MTPCVPAESNQRSHIQFTAKLIMTRLIVTFVWNTEDKHSEVYTFLHTSDLINHLYLYRAVREWTINTNSFLTRQQDDQQDGGGHDWTAKQR